MEPLANTETPSNSHCGMHGAWTPAAIGCRHVYTGAAGPAKIKIHYTNRRIACTDCFDKWDLLTYYCPACYLSRLKKFYPLIAKQVDSKKWFEDKN